MGVRVGGMMELSDFAKKQLRRDRSDFAKRASSRQVRLHQKGFVETGPASPKNGFVETSGMVE